MEVYSYKIQNSTHLEIIIYPAIVGCIQIVLAVAVVFFSTNYIPHGPHVTEPLVNDWFRGFARWDGSWYLSIAENGYFDLQQTAFFPFYPMMIRFFHWVTSFPYLTVAFWISNLSFLAGIIFLYEMLFQTYGLLVAKKTIWFLVAFPASMFFNVAYTESLTLLTTILFFYFIRKDMWYSAMWSGFIATGVHDLGVVLAFPAVYYLWERRQFLSQRELIIRFLSISLIGLSLLGYMIFLLNRFDNPIAFAAAQHFWDRKIVIPVINIIISFVIMLMKTYDWNWITMNLVNGVYTLIFVAFGWMMVLDKRHRILPLDMKLFFWITLALSIISGTGYGTQSYARFMSVIFPGFIFMARFGWPPILQKCFLTISMMVKFFLLGMFCNGYWVT